MVHSPPGATPTPGDIVLSRANDGSIRYLLSKFGGAPQIMCAAYEDAVAEAYRFARAQNLDVWQTDDNRTFRRILECRMASSA